MAKGKPGEDVSGVGYSTGGLVGWYSFAPFFLMSRGRTVHDGSAPSCIDPKLMIESEGETLNAKGGELLSLSSVDGLVMETIGVTSLVISSDFSRFGRLGILSREESRERLPARYVGDEAKRELSVFVELPWS
ncbi:hypothetical protein M8818_003774 [Zalaria obscura]|uniref:Uncharacterized protein n=1 Tax=Zalaria obscura TaxID=2024903 RepID=A0ACC3SDS5_9PEZI